MKGTLYQTEKEILQRAEEIIGIPLGQIDLTGRLATGKGAIGTVIEESWFGYTPNSESEPDFPEAGVELKVTPYIYNQNGAIRAKERLVCNLIDYMKEYQAEIFEQSSFWHKCHRMLLMSYLHRYDVSKALFTIDRTILFSFPDEDLIIIKRDWAIIISKIRAGKAHEITEGDTLYLAACTKGATAETFREQPFSYMPAKQRAYSLKSSYMTSVLNSYIFGNKEDEHIIKSSDDIIELEGIGLEGVIKNRIIPYIGKTVDELKETFNIDSSAKSINALILTRMLGLNVNGPEYIEEFKRANIVPKTIRVEENGKVRESMSFPTFKFMEIINQEWEDSPLREQLEPVKFLFVIFKRRSGDDYVLSSIKFWNIPYADLMEVRKVWERTKAIIKEGPKLTVNKNGTVSNNLPKKMESPVCHVRPKATNAADTFPLPTGGSMTKQCFWLNNTYIEHIISQ